jgi:hypothetical protein
MTLRDWTSGRLAVDQEGRGTGVQDVIPVGAHGLKATRTGRPPAYVYCPEAGEEPFTPDDLDAARREMGGLEFVVVTKRPIANATYARADDLGVFVGGLGALHSALRGRDDVGTYKSKNHEFVQSRLSAHRHVATWQRVAYDAYALERPNGLRTLTIVTLNPYEVTQEEAYRLINAHPEIDVDALVTTNPSCTGFSRATLEAVSHAGVEILTFRDFLSSLGEPWEE